MKAYAYCLQRDASDRSLDDQERAIRRWAAHKRIDVVGVYRDAPTCTRFGIVLERTVCDMLDKALARGHAIIVADHDRSLRLDIEIDLRAAGARVLVVGEHIKRRAPPVDETAVERLLRGRAAAARAGRHQGGPAPYGYARDRTSRALGVRLTVHPEEAPVVRTIFLEYLRRRSMKKLIEHLNGQGLKTRRGADWSRAGVSWILNNRIYLGLVRHGAIRAKGRHPRIISPIMFNKVQHLIGKNNKRGERSKA